MYGSSQYVISVAIKIECMILYVNIYNFITSRRRRIILLNEKFSNTLLYVRTVYYIGRRNVVRAKTLRVRDFRVFARLKSSSPCRKYISKLPLRTILYRNSITRHRFKKIL